MWGLNEYTLAVGDGDIISGDQMRWTTGAADSHPWLAMTNDIHAIISEKQQCGEMKISDDE